MLKKTAFFFYFFFALTIYAAAEDGYRLWLRYDKVDNPTLLAQYKQLLSNIYISGFTSPADGNSTKYIIENELKNGLGGLLNTTVKFSAEQPTLIIGKNNRYPSSPELTQAETAGLGNEGFAIVSKNISGKKIIIITGNSDVALLYGTFHLLRLVQTQQPVNNLKIISVPKIKNRILNHWDNLNRHVERGYAGLSIWNWHTLPDIEDKRYTDYARANASIGINGTVLTNVNANALILSKEYLLKVAALANIFRPYGIKVYLTARFSAPVEIGGLKTADPLDINVQKWWQGKAKEIYSLIPDFGGFLVKANSEGQPGPQSYERTHADGANLLADAVAPFGGIVMWRAFVYGEGSKDRFKQAYEEFQPLDGKFKPNVIVQVKNGPIDFQPREPFSPLFGAMPKTALGMEFQLTQEYLGQGTHLVYEAPMFKEVLDADTYIKGKGSTVSKIIDGSLDHNSNSVIAGVSNIGNERNWTGHPFAQANWYAFGRLAWNDQLSSSDIATEWIAQTFSNSKDFIDPVREMMLASHETLVNYMTPLGLHHIMGNGHHYGPAPWSDNLPRPDWNPVYYHKADSAGIGFDRTETGSNALSQYSAAVQKMYATLSTCDEKYLLWFNHVPWTHKMRSGKTLWEELCNKYQEGVNGAKKMRLTWERVEKKIDEERSTEIKMLLMLQEKEAIWWKNACLLYFQTFSKMPFPANMELPDQTLDYYRSLKFPNAPGN